MHVTSKEGVIHSLVEINKTHDLQHAKLAVELVAHRNGHNEAQYNDEEYMPKNEFWQRVLNRIVNSGIYYSDGWQGWMDRNGKLWTNLYSCHSNASSIFNLDTAELENAGWIHVSSRHPPITSSGVCYTRRTTERQRRKLREWGIEINAAYEIEKANPNPKDLVDLSFDGYSKGGVVQFSISERNRPPVPSLSSAITMMGFG